MTDRQPPIRVIGDVQKLEESERSARYGRVGSIVLSADFLVAVPAGIGAGVLVALSKTVGSQASTILLAIGALLATLAGIVIAAHTIMISLMSAEYMLVLERASGGIRAVSRPYKIVIWTCAFGVLASLFAVLVWPLIPSSAFLAWRLIRGIALGVPVALGAYGLIGSAQLAGLNAFHLENRASLLRTIRDVRQRTNKDRSA